MIKLIIFDLDGTLVNSIVDITNALNYATEPYGLGKYSAEETVSMVGEGVTRLIEQAVGPERAARVQEVLERFLEHYSRHLLDFTLPYPGVRETLDKLGGYRKAIISNKRESLSKKLVDELGLSRYFDVVFGSDSVSEKKPSPKPVLRLLDLFSLFPGEAVLVGDSNYDIEAGHAAGVITIGVTFGFGKPAGADYLIGSFPDLLVRLNEINER